MKKVVIKRTSKKGKGVFAAEDIKKGDLMLIGQ